MGLKRAPQRIPRTGLPGTEAHLLKALLNHVWAGLPVSRTTTQPWPNSERWLSLRLCVRGGAAGAGEAVFKRKPTRLTRRVDGVNGLRVYAVAYGGGSMMHA